MSARSDLPPLRIAVAADLAGRDYKHMLLPLLRGHPLVAAVVDVHPRENLTYPQAAVAAANLVKDGAVDRALLVCHTGLGMAITANKVPGVRAVTCHDLYSLRASVLSNNAQVLAIGQGVIGPGLAKQLVTEWPHHRFDPAASASQKIAMIEAFERTGSLELHGREDRHADQP
ncbi:RpiB/LacA/LacB family sugar-phosphate isomerase [Streptomyces sp. NPDC004311]|uniref:RpiB/LacA/LacB family sugar-phosphate isomerase n=1 Tax=Streptomyces sp. NPDC004311 TaxID=3364698 RepID=UPI00368D6910